jgi:hypothetical protein
MKKSIFYLSVLAVAATTLFACNKLEVKQEAVNEPQTVTFNAGVAPTKTTFGALDVNKYPTIWTENDANVKIAQNFSAGIDAAVTKVSDSQATFAASFTADPSGSYTFYAVSPASAVVSGVNSSFKSWHLEIPTDQTSTATGPDEDAMIMVASSSTVSTFPTSVDLSFTHLTAYAKMSIINLALDGGDQISSVLITGSNNIAYRYYYYVGGEKIGTFEETSYAQNSITVHTTSASNIWFACAPMAAGTGLTIAVTTTNSKVYTKTGINIPSALAAGEVAVFNVDFNGISADETKVYSLVKNYSELTDGSKVIISALGEADYAMGIMTSDNNFASHVATAKSADNQTITNPPATVDVFTLGVGTVDNTIAFNGTNGYLYASSSSKNYMSVQTTNDANGSWTPTIKNNSTGEVILKANGTNNPYMRYNGSADRFSCYSTEGDNVAIYKLNGSGSSTQLYDNLKLKQVTITDASGDNTGFTATWEKPSNAPETGVTYTYTLYEGTDATGTFVVSGTVTDALTLTNSTALSDGQYYLTIIASAAGYIASAPAGRGFTVAAGGGVDYANTHTSNVTLNKDKEDSENVFDGTVVIGGNEYDALKAGTSSKGGKIAIAVPSGKTTLYFHAVAWNDQANITLSAEGGTLSSNSLTASTGARGNSPYTMTDYNSSTMFFTLTLPSNPSGTTIKLSASKRFIVWGVNTD